MMADELLNDGGDTIFVYMGGDQEVPPGVRRAKIDESIDTIPYGAFAGCDELTELEGHDKLKKIEREAFWKCPSLRRLTKMQGVKEIYDRAFLGCHALSDLEFDKLEIVGDSSFAICKSLRSINLPSVRRVGVGAFFKCIALTEAVFGKDLESIGRLAFLECHVLGRIAIPLKDNLIISEYDAFNVCGNLSRVDIVGGIHKTISSLHMESWRGTLTEEINRINQTLPETPIWKTVAIKEWIESVIDRIEHYKTEHKVLVKEAMALLELALWKAKLIDENDGNESELTMVQRKRARQERRITSGASIVIKNVLPFLELK